MEIENIKAAATEFELVHPGSQTPLGIHFNLAPLHSSEVKKVERRIRDKVSKMRARGKFPSAVEQENNELDLICAAILGWRWESDDERGIEQPTLNDEIPEFTPENVKNFVRKEWVKEQLDMQLGDIAGFFKI